MRQIAPKHNLEKNHHPYCSPTTKSLLQLKKHVISQEYLFILVFCWGCFHLDNRIASDEILKRKKSPIIPLLQHTQRYMDHSFLHSFIEFTQLYTQCTQFIPFFYLILHQSHLAMFVHSPYNDHFLNGFIITCKLLLVATKFFWVKNR